MNDVTLILPYYRQPDMLARQLNEILRYPPGINVIVVDDGSPEPAEDVVRDYRVIPGLLDRLRLYRITVDVPWNREECRNLGAKEAETDWIVQVDIDHVLPVASAKALLAFNPDPGCWYRFPRWRVGKADETRRKDRVSEDADYVHIHPHQDSYLVSKEMYWRSGGYDERFAGVLGGGSEFLRRLSGAGRPEMLPDGIALHVYTRHSVADASDRFCSRDREPGKKIERELRRGGRHKPDKWLLQPWERVL